MVKSIINEYTENTYIINEKKEAYIIDPGASFKDIEAYITSEGFDVIGVLLTHGHFDHLYTLNKVVEKYECKVYIHNKERDFLFDPNLNLSSSIRKPIVLKSKKSVQTLSDDQVIPFGHNEIKVIPTPGHTRGGVSYKYKRFLFSGDTLFKGTIGRYDLPTSNKTDLERSLQRLLKECKDNTVVYPGHGHFTTILNEKYENPYLQNIK